MSKHTPGPWINDGDGIVWSESNPIYGWIADCRNGPQDANARLIAAAPLMYDFVASAAAGGDNKALAIMEAINGRS